MNHYKDDGYSGQSNNRIQHTGYNIPPPQAHNMVGVTNKSLEDKDLNFKLTLSSLGIHCHFFSL